LSSGSSIPSVSRSVILIRSIAEIFDMRGRWALRTRLIIRPPSTVLVKQVHRSGGAIDSRAGEMQASLRVVEAGSFDAPSLADHRGLDLLRAKPRGSGRTAGEVVLDQPEHRLVATDVGDGVSRGAAWHRSEVCSFPLEPRLFPGADPFRALL
jgi:hypothetical protein